MLPKTGPGDSPGPVLFLARPDAAGSVAKLADASYMCCAL